MVGLTVATAIPTIQIALLTNKTDKTNVKTS
jgi:hypothetical protein